MKTGHFEVLLGAKLKMHLIEQLMLEALPQ